MTIHSKHINFVLLQFQWILHSPLVLLQIGNSWDIIANISFVSGPWPNCSKSANFVLLQFQRILHSPPILLQIGNSWTVIANTSFVSCIRSCDWQYPARVIANQDLLPPTVLSCFYSRFIYLHIFLGFCFPTCWLGHTISIIITNELVLLCSNPWLKFCCPVISKPQTVFLCFNPCRSIQTGCFQPIFNFTNPSRVMFQ